MSAMADKGLIPSGRLWEQFRSCLSPRQSGHSTLHATTTVAVLLILPPQAGEIHATITALLTFPVMEHIPLEEVHVTWIFHQ